MAKTYIIIVTIAAIVLGIYAILPNKEFNESVFPLTNNTALFAYDDKSDGGYSEIEFTQNDSSLQFSCTLGQDTTKGAWCGMLFDLSPQLEQGFRNWTFVDSLVFEIEAEGTREILIKVWTFDTDVTDIKKSKTFRLLLKELPVSKELRRIALPMEQFYTPEFWYSDAKADTTLKRNHIETVARVEIAPGWNQKRGEKFSLKIKSISAKGISNLAFGIVMFIMLGLMIVAIGRKHSLEKKSNEA